VIDELVGQDSISTQENKKVRHVFVIKFGLNIAQVVMAASE